MKNAANGNRFRNSAIWSPRNFRRPRTTRYEPANLPSGSVVDFRYYSTTAQTPSARSSMRRLKQVVIAFRGTTTWPNSSRISPIPAAPNGNRSRASSRAFWRRFAPRCPGYEIMTDGHSLGGGMAQTAALENGLSGYGQNSLPISPDAIQDINSAGGLARPSQLEGRRPDIQRDDDINNITTTVYAGDLNLYTNSITAANTSTTTLPNITPDWKATERDIGSKGTRARRGGLCVAARGAWNLQRHRRAPAKFRQPGERPRRVSVDRRIGPQRNRRGL